MVFIRALPCLSCFPKIIFSSFAVFPLHFFISAPTTSLSFLEFTLELKCSPSLYFTICFGPFCPFCFPVSFPSSFIAMETRQLEECAGPHSNTGKEGAWLSRPLSRLKKNVINDTECRQAPGYLTGLQTIWDANEYETICRWSFPDHQFPTFFVWMYLIYFSKGAWIKRISTQEHWWSLHVTASLTAKFKQESKHWSDTDATQRKQICSDTELTHGRATVEYKRNSRWSESLEICFYL